MMRLAPAPSRAAGFSLLEILVVLFIIGIMVGMIVQTVDFGVGDNRSRLEQQVERLLDLSSLAEDRAILTGEPIGLLLLPPGDEPVWQYTWQRYRGGQWVATEEPLTGDQLPETAELSLEVEGELADFPDRQPGDPPPLPSVVFYPGGEVTPFVLRLFESGAMDQQIILTSEQRGFVEQVTEDELAEWEMNQLQ